MTQTTHEPGGYSPFHDLDSRSLLRAAPIVEPNTTNSEVLRIFSQNNDLIGLPVIEEGIPIGIINRHIFMNSFARPFHNEIFGKKSCIAFMDKDPLIVDHRTSIQELSEKVVEAGKKAVTDGFIITKEARYLGVGVGYDLIRAVADLHAKKNQALMESIGYASVIQRSLLSASDQAMTATLQEFFLYWHPKDLIGGDCYHFANFPEGYFLAIMDCTGHGVPGAFVTLIMSSALNRALHSERLYADPAAVLAYVNKTSKHELNQLQAPVSTLEHRETQSDDGMDVAACWFDRSTGNLTYAGARIPLFLLAEDDSEVSRLEGDRKGVGYLSTPLDYQWNNQVVSSGNTVRHCYIATDGIFDQIGGDKQISFGKNRLQKMILDYRGNTLAEQKDLMIRQFLSYQGQQKRRDDVTLVGWQP